MPPIIDKTKCVGCHTCVRICPTDTFGVQKEKKAVPTVRFAEECWHCNACVFDCPMQAIRLRTPVPAMLVYTTLRK